MNKNIVFIGVGNMGSAILCGAVEKSGFSEKNIFAHSLSFSDKAKKLNINVTTLQNLVNNSDYIILCIKPSGFDSLLNEIKSIDGYETKVYISIAAGITIDRIKNVLGPVKIIRTMPNLALSVGAGMTVIAPGDKICTEELAFAERIFSGAGKTLVVEEKLIDSCTAISGSGPAYVFMFIEALADAAVRGGLSRKDAYVLASQTLMGSALLQIETGTHPGELKDMVCSPGGTTIEAVASLEKDGFRSAVMNAVDVCAKKASDILK